MAHEFGKFPKISINKEMLKLEPHRGLHLSLYSGKIKFMKAGKVIILTNIL